MKFEKKAKSYAFCLFCSCFRSQEILFIFIEAKVFRRNSFPFGIFLCFISGLLLPLYISTQLWFNVYIIRFQLSNWQSDFQRFMLYSLFFIFSFLRTITRLTIYETAFLPIFNSWSYSPAYTKINIYKLYIHNAQCIHSMMRRKRKRYMHGINAQQSSMVIQQQQQKNHKLNIAPYKLK